MEEELLHQLSVILIDETRDDQIEIRGKLKETHGVKTARHLSKLTMAEMKEARLTTMEARTIFEYYNPPGTV